MKVQLKFNNKHLVAKGVEVEKAIKKLKLYHMSTMS
jgi:hypothetical protein